MLLFSWLEIKWVRYSHFVVFWKTLYKSAGTKITKWSYIRYLTSDQENNGTLFSLTFKVEGNNVPLFSWLGVKWFRYSHFVVLKKTIYMSAGAKITKWLYLSHLTFNRENKAILFSLTFKVEGNKVFLFSWLEVKWLRYGSFVVLTPAFI